MAIGEKDPNRAHARRSRAARAWANLTTKQLGEALGKAGTNARKYVERRESGEVDYSRSELLHIARLTGAPEEFMLNGAGWSATSRDGDVGRRAPETPEQSAAARQQRRRNMRPQDGEDRSEEGTG